MWEAPLNKAGPGQQGLLFLPTGGLVGWGTHRTREQGDQLPSLSPSQKAKCLQPWGDRRHWEGHIYVPALGSAMTAGLFSGAWTPAHMRILDPHNNQL